MPDRKPTRIPGFAYDHGAWFVTICTKDRAPLFGSIVGAGSKPARVELTDAGKIVEETWFDLPNHTKGVILGPFVVMPDHVHGIIQLDGQRAGLEPAPTPLTEVVRQFKTFSARKINRMRGTPGSPLWQRNYYEHGIRSEEDWRDCVNYILNNPTAWMLRKTEQRQVPNPPALQCDHIQL